VLKIIFLFYIPIPFHAEFPISVKATCKLTADEGHLNSLGQFENPPELRTRELAQFFLGLLVYGYSSKRHRGVQRGHQDSPSRVSELEI